MTDRLCRGLVPSTGLRAVFVRVADTARMARMLHGLYPTSAHLFAQALAAGALLGALQKEKGRVNLQVECDGPVRGVFVDADPDGQVRGYVRGPAVNFPGDPARGARAALGGSGLRARLHRCAVSGAQPTTTAPPNVKFSGPPGPYHQTILQEARGRVRCNAC